MATSMRPVSSFFRKFNMLKTISLPCRHVQIFRLFATTVSKASLVQSFNPQCHNRCATRLGTRSLGQLGLVPVVPVRWNSSQKSALDDEKATKTDEDSGIKPQMTSEEQEKARTANYHLRSMKFGLVGLSVLFSGTLGYLLAVWGEPKVDEDGKIIKDEFSDMSPIKSRILRTWKEMSYYEEMIKEPSREKLLPDPVTEPYYQPPYTLVLEMTGILVHPEWTYKTGWRFKKRPGIDFFLQNVGPPMFEIVIYTSEPGMTAHPLVDSLDPNGYISYRLYRDTTRYEGGHHVKDLSGLNRDLSRVIVIDWNEKSIKLQPENALKLKKWTGADNDGTLFDLAMFLRTIVASEIEDVRPVLQFFGQFDDPLLEFKENQRRLRAEQEQLQRAVVEKAPNLAGTFSNSVLGRRK